MTNKNIANTFRLLAELMELHGENPFKIRSYEVAARTIEQYPQPLAAVPASQIEDLPGVGKAIAGKISDLLKTGTFDLLDRLLAVTPAGITEMLQIKGLGPKKVKILWQELNIESVGELLYACQENRLLHLKGFGEKTQENVKKSVEYFLANAKYYRYADMEPEALYLQQAFAQLPGVERVELTGAFRRKCEVLEFADLLIAGNWSNLQNWCSQLQITLLAVQEQTATAQSATGLPLQLHNATAQNFAYRLLQTTAAPAHWQQLIAIKEPNPGSHNETDIYQQLGLPFIEPELREGLDEIELARHGQLPPQLLQITDITGIIHAHSTYSDGRDPLETMARACMAAGYLYLGISDHSKAAFYANGLAEAAIIKQHEEVDRLNQTLAPFRIFKGIEADILNDGSLDYNHEVLQSFDFVIASIHSTLQMTEEKAMTRLIRAIENPHTTILGHLTGRLLLSRAGYPVNHRKIIDACAANKVIIEINANPYRLDIDWRWIPYCMEKGALISVNPDAHSTAGIDDVKYGVFAARKGKLTKEYTLNTRTPNEIARIFTQK
ncbi:DNA polymerase/3'-5' exonuclease PolX [Sphingobacteriales bacterium UPWRP_1]|nr:hypothetical protein BVG80_09470 [Sphingobacteriales bacterium TSM_CSM]PSJ78579.1 DNA polymerase/3'-5' exonuclease PolX [Sphingobacteriales bacterium UPWRP_1]